MLMTDKQVRIQLKRDTAENWKRENIVLLEGEIGYEIDTGRYKIGRIINGELMSWNELDYSNEDFNLYLERLEQYGDGNIEPTSDEYFLFELNTDEKSYTILPKEGLNSAKIETLAIPYKYNGLPVTNINSLQIYFCYHNNYVKKIYIPNNIININGSYNFTSCENLESIKFSMNLIRIEGLYNFSGNTKVNEVILPDSLQTIPNECFYGADSAVDQTIIFYIPKKNSAIYDWCDSNNCHWAYYDDLVLTASDDETKKFKIRIDSSGSLTATALFTEETAAAATTIEETEAN